jgi:hypothetical protein
MYAYIALVPGKDRTRPDLAAEIGRRLLQAGRAKEAVADLEVAAPKKRTTRSDPDDDDLYATGWHRPDAEWEGSVTSRAVCDASRCLNLLIMRSA